MNRKVAKAILTFCKTPRTAKEIVDALKISPNLAPTLVRNGWLKRIDTRPMTFQTVVFPEHLEWPSPLTHKNMYLLTALLNGQRTYNDMREVCHRPDIAYASFIEHKIVERTYDPTAFHLSPKGEALLAKLGYKRVRINSIFNFGAAIEHRSISQSV